MRDQILLVLPTSWEPSKQAFLKQLGVSEGGLGEQLFGRVFDALFVNSTEMKREFKRYYAVEYGSLENYAWIVHGVELDDDELAHERIFFVTWLPQVVDENYEENQLDTILACIDQLERANNEAEA
ncbi:hypothetical protein GTA62_20910 [Roseobacter sp. HKCCD9010]|uniref:hypothetical protein n=1 Tax=unclassified Roseobacter TaxID=196798 RepID=UPI001491DEF6|nr:MULTISPECIES: hypothetical protein [unclassified Roseobacter]MBF9052398.1 hypothetical protein [Rhodobacterales bacterium HKCCD4356]NNV14387.1 hypothetical protein [Roseobacter sp. HKCCD7357]NNV18565.1 hypothetical protein [Roseobacter sp. HKCCD8768]NNV28080.1 hypothetical protein [Roseobacter sp. HKCCD8192]NNV32330.1 hypothetical protein [Roseobacter sp. HKCCD9061]